MTPATRHKARPRERRTPSEDRNVLRATVDAYGPEEAEFMDDDVKRGRKQLRTTPSTDQ